MGKKTSKKEALSVVIRHLQTTTNKNEQLTLNS